MFIYVGYLMTNIDCCEFTPHNSRIAVRVFSLRDKKKKKIP